MKTAAPDVTELVRGWTEEERKLALGIIIGDTFAENGDTLFAVNDENDLSLAIVQPLRVTVTDLVLDDSTPYLRELRRRAESAEDSISHEDLLEQMQKEERESVFYYRMNQTFLSDGSEFWFDQSSAREWQESSDPGPNRIAISRATGIAWKHEKLFLTRCGTFIMNFRDEHDYPNDRYVQWGQQQSLEWLRANGHEVSADQLAEAEQIRELEI
jgi:hypothetical protein